MPSVNIYDRRKAVAYAKEWAKKRNPKYTNFELMGGDCTNFASQCIFAGSDVMNYTPDTGWYYVSLASRSPSWAGVEFLHRFLVNNYGAGPFAAEKPLDGAKIGDIIQLSFNGRTYEHSLVVVKASDEILVAAHTYDAFERKLSSYNYADLRLIHIEGVRK